MYHRTLCYTVYCIHCYIINEQLESRKLQTMLSFRIHYRPKICYRVCRMWCRACLESEASPTGGSAEGRVDGLQQKQVLLVQQVHLLRVQPLCPEGVGAGEGHRPHPPGQVLLCQPLDSGGDALCLLPLWHSAGLRVCIVREEAVCTKVGL